MNTRYNKSVFSRAIAGLSLTLSILGSTGFAAAKSCTIPFPNPAAKTCQQGNSKAVSTHFLAGNPVKFNLFIDMQGGTLGASAYGIDVNGNKLSACATTVADSNPTAGVQTAVSCATLYGTPGTAPPSRSYNHPNNMASTFVIVI